MASVYSLGQTRIGVSVAVEAADGHVVRNAIARKSGVPVPGPDADRGGFAVFFRARDLTGVTVARVAVHLERGPVIYNAYKANIKRRLT